MEKDIRKKLLERAKDTCSYMLEKGVTLQEIEEIVNNIPNCDFSPRIITINEEACNDMLYDTDVAKIIEYLSEYKDCKLVLDSCDDNTPLFLFKRKENETDEEIVCRLLPDVKSECSDIIVNKAKKLAIKEEKRRLQEKIKELDRQLNSM